MINANLQITLTALFLLLPFVISIVLTYINVRNNDIIWGIIFGVMGIFIFRCYLYMTF
jgi:hypothetical protein